MQDRISLLTCPAYYCLLEDGKRGRGFCWNLIIQDLATGEHLSIIKHGRSMEEAGLRKITSMAKSPSGGKIH